ncbi:MAG: hypothetical protein HQL66_01775 [Magnetococcales bacterium]|nr:hypothetical protein [Magnetococcales bacterium]
MSVFDFTTPDAARSALASVADHNWPGATSFTGFCAWAVTHHARYTAFDDRMRYEYRTGLRDPEEDQIAAMLKDYLQGAM